MDLLEQEWSGFEPRTSEFKTDHSAIEPSHTFTIGDSLGFINSTSVLLRFFLVYVLGIRVFF